MGKCGDDGPRFSFVKQANANKYKKWARKMQYSFESTGLLNYILLDKKKPKPVAIVFKGKALNNIAKIER